MQAEFPGGGGKAKAKKDAEAKRSRGRPPLPKGLRCEKCNTTDTPEWRVGENGSHTLCNACGLQYAKKKKVEIESKAKHSIKNILNDNEPAAAVVTEIVQRAQQDFQIHNATYGKTQGVPSYHNNKNKRPSAIAVSPAGSPMLTRANSGNNISPMSFAPASPFNFQSYFSAMSLGSPTASSTPPPPFATNSPVPPRMSPFNPAAHSPTPYHTQQQIPDPYTHTPTLYISEADTKSSTPPPTSYHEKAMETVSMVPTINMGPSSASFPQQLHYTTMGEKMVDMPLPGEINKHGSPGHYGFNHNNTHSFNNSSPMFSSSNNPPIPSGSKPSNPNIPNYDNMDYL